MIKTLQPLNWYRYCLPEKGKQNDLHFSDQIKYVYINKGTNNHNFNDKDLSEKKKKNIHMSCICTNMCQCHYIYYSVTLQIFTTQM